MSSENFSRPGAVDLSSLQAEHHGGGGFVVAVNQENFQAEVLNRSMSVPVVVLFSGNDEASGQLVPVLEDLSGEYQGRFLLTKVDVSKDQTLAAAAGVQQIPTVLGVVRGQAVPLFAGALPHADVRRFIDELLKVAVSNGITGKAEPVSHPEGEGAGSQPAMDPRFEEAYKAMAAGDYEAAAKAYKTVLSESPQDSSAKTGLAQAELLRRAAKVDEIDAQERVEKDAGDVTAQLQLADVDVAAGRVDEGFARLLSVVSSVHGEDRERVRAHLLELFEVVGATDQRVVKARLSLANALF